MQPKLRPSIAGAVAAILVACGAASAQSPQAVTAAATRTLHRPTTITRPGLYTVGSELAVGAGETAIVVRADDVTLDLGGRTLSGPGGPGSIGVEIRGASNVTVHNGSLVGFGIGVMLTDAVNVVVEDLQIHATDAGGAPPDVEIGILLVDSRGVAIVGNVITEVFLGVFVRGGGSGGNRIAGNTITGGENGQLAICYNPAPTGGAAGPAGDLVYGNLVSRFNVGIALSTESRANVIRENSLATFEAGIDEAVPGSNLIENNATVQLTP
jgi:hypothetical protein